MELKSALRQKNHTMLLPINSFIKRDNILDKYNKYIFISPHLDDAILSCGNLIYELNKRGKKIIIATVFTEASKIESPQAKEFLNQCRYKNAQKLFKARKIEDLNVCRALGISSIHMGFIDAAWRESNNKLIYTTNDKQYNGIISTKDKGVINKIRLKINKLVNKNYNILLLSPLGIGNHVDHLIVNKIVNKTKIDKLFWEDFPYNTNRNNIMMFRKRNKIYKPINFHYYLNKNTKLEAILKYKTQINVLFPGDNIKLKRESYYKHNL